VLYCQRQRTERVRYGGPDVTIEAKTTKKRQAELTKESATAETQDHSSLDPEDAPAASGKADRKYLRMVLWACLSLAFLAGGCLASGLLSAAESLALAVLLFIAALVGAAGCMFYFYRFLREISPGPRPPFISTLH
jgi:hypothetical protein